MKLSTATTLLFSVVVAGATVQTTTAFVPSSGAGSPPFVTKQQQQQHSVPLIRRMGYLDDLSGELAPSPDPNPVPDEEDRDALKMSKEQLDRAGPGSWDQYVEFDEFDGGDGQMGVAGDGNKKLESFDMSQMAKSKTMSYVLLCYCYVYLMTEWCFCPSSIFDPVAILFFLFFSLPVTQFNSKFFFSFFFSPCHSILCWFWFFVLFCFATNKRNSTLK